MMKIFKKWWFWLIIVIVVIAVIVGDSEEEPKKEVKPDEKQEEKQPDEKEIIDPVDTSWDDFKESDKITGKSDKDFKVDVSNKPAKVRNDKTGNFRITKISENIDIEKYALSYAETYMEDNEIHFIVNFSRKTTTRISKMDNLLYVDIKEYVDKEEHDASDLGAGMLLKSYVVFPDGDIQELEEG